MPVLSRGLDKPTIVLNFQDDRPENGQKEPKNSLFLDTKSAIRLDGSKRNETCLW